MQRVIAYVDGFNLYYGLRSKKWKRYYWLNIKRLAQLMLKPGQRLEPTRYFTTIVKHPHGKNRRQAVFRGGFPTRSFIRCPETRSHCIYKRQPHYAGQERIP